MSTASAITTASLNLLVLRSKDMDRLAAFYRAMGLEMVKHSHPPCGEHYATEGDGCTFEIYPERDDSPASTGLFFGLQVSSIDAAVRVVQENGGELVRPPTESAWGRSATISDPDGHRVLLSQQAE